MSERELNRIEVLAQVDDGRLSVQNGANMLDTTKRQMFRLLKTYRTDGAAAIRHKARGKTPNNKIHKAKRDYAVALVEVNCADFGPTLAAEMLAEHHGFKVSRETLRKCPLMHALHALSDNRWWTTVSGFCVNSGAQFINPDHAGNASAS